ncbi:neural cell adhesion molecule 1-like [Haliotis asinina]|uniref:neural cell adhesion molecule 1-like n=1 Tax=Haliotis asinina TaxID=109174 RepID=UPI0035324632
MKYTLLMVICLSPFPAFAQEIVIGPPVDEIGNNPKVFSIYCKVPGLSNSYEHLEWLDRNDDIIGRSSDRSIFASRYDSSLYLFFENWNDKDAGTYTCRGDIFGRNMSKSVQLYFEETQDIILNPPEDTSRVEDSGSYTLHCEVVGLSRGHAKLEWLDNNMGPIGPLNESDPKTNRVYTVHRDRRCRLKFDQVKAEDHGKYTCRVSHEGVTKHKSVRLNVYGVVTFPQEDVVRVEMQTGTAIKCQVTETQGGRNVTVDWLYANGYTISGYEKCCPRSNRYFAHQTSMGSTLFFDELLKRDKGKYYCRVKIDGNTVYKGIQLQFQAAPQIVISPAESSIRRKKGTSGSMYCKVKGLSGKQLRDAKFEWLDKHDNIIGLYMKDGPTRNRVYTVVLPDATRLQLDQLTSGENGTYTCRCTVGGNIMIKDIDLNIYGKPDTPTNLQAAFVDTNSITITWNKGYNGDTKQRFNIEYRQRGGQWTTHPTMPRDHHALELTLGGLKPATVYEIRINAVNKYGSSGYTSVNMTTV